MIAIWSLTLASKVDGRCSEGLGAQERLVDGGCGVRQGRRRFCVAVFGNLNTVRLSLVVRKMLASLQEDSRGA
jgi:hypothetical protein